RSLSLTYYLFTHTSCPFYYLYAATSYIYTLSLHDALPISSPQKSRKLHTVFRIDHVVDDFVVIQNGFGDIQPQAAAAAVPVPGLDRKSTRLNSSHVSISYAVFCLKKKKQKHAEASSPNTKQ